MNRDRAYYVYILASRSRNLYTGVTNNLKRRVLEHKERAVPGFTRKYRIHRLVYFEVFDDIRQAIVCEKRVKSWRREKKIALISAYNPTWDDLATDWYDRKRSGKADPSLALGMTTKPKGLQPTGEAEAVRSTPKG